MGLFSPVLHGWLQGYLSVPGPSDEWALSDRRVMLRFQGSAITSDGGLLAYRELDDVLALSTSGGERLGEARTGRNRRHLLVGLLRQSVFGRLAGLRGCERRRSVVPRSGDALGGRRQLNPVRPHGATGGDRPSGGVPGIR